MRVGRGRLGSRDEQKRKREEKVRKKCVFEERGKNTT